MGSWWEDVDRQASDGGGEKDYDGNLQKVLAEECQDYEKLILQNKTQGRRK